MRIFGILNITEDSFSDGRRYLSPDIATQHAQKLMRDGADVIDIGAASSNPNAVPVSPDIEIARLAPVVAALKSSGIPISIDTFAPEVQRWALSRDAEYLNDIQGFPDAEWYPLLAASRAKLVVMHSVQGRGPATRIRVSADSMMARITDYFEARIEALERAGISRDRIILDPGMGLFLGTDKDASFTVLRGLASMKRHFDLPILVSVSRKSFLRKLTGRAVGGSGAATLAAELFAVFQGADYIRTHEPAPLRDALAVWEVLNT